MVGREVAAIRAELVEGGDLELAMENTRERQDVPIDIAGEPDTGDDIEEGSALPCLGR
jgi:hypothetical protein